MSKLGIACLPDVQIKENETFAGFAKPRTQLSDVLESMKLAPYVRTRLRHSFMCTLFFLFVTAASINEGPNFSESEDDDDNSRDELDDTLGGNDVTTM